MKSLDEYEFGGRPQSSINILCLISEMEGTYQHLKFMGFKDDMNVQQVLLDVKKQREYIHES